jgi:hypothetical protein
VKAGPNQHAHRPRQGKRAAAGVQAASRLPDSNRTRGAAPSCRVPASDLDAKAEDVATLPNLHAREGRGVPRTCINLASEAMEPLQSDGILVRSGESQVSRDTGFRRKPLPSLIEWHARGQGFKSPILHSRLTVLLDRSCFSVPDISSIVSIGSHLDDPIPGPDPGERSFSAHGEEAGRHDG